MSGLRFGEVVGAVMGLVAVFVVAYASVVQFSEAAMTALVALVGTAAGYFLRAKLEPPK